MKLTLPVLPPQRPEFPPPASVRLSEPMLRFRCNQKGCCCSGWDIPFRLEDFVRLHEHLAPEERGSLTRLEQEQVRRHGYGSPRTMSCART